jgi:formamidopyrimidine-DNA glycosylase
MLSREATRNNGGMPELPDLRVLSEAFTAALVGRPLEAAAIRQPLVLRGTQAELRAFEGGELERVEQRGKFLTLVMGPDRIVVNAMLTGRLGLAVPGRKADGSTALELRFGPRAAPADGSMLADWTVAADWLPPDDTSVELRYRDPRKMGKVYLLPAGIERVVAGLETLGPDADDPALDLATWEQRIRRHSGELGNLLKNQEFIAGIGNAYSDEILWAARVAPFRRRASLASEETAAIWRAAREVCAWAIEELRVRVPPTFDKQARDFLRVHLHGGEPCPRCGSTLSEVSPGGFTTTWCRSCQV